MEKWKRSHALAPSMWYILYTHWCPWRLKLLSVKYKRPQAWFRRRLAQRHYHMRHRIWCLYLCIMNLRADDCVYNSVGDGGALAQCPGALLSADVGRSQSRQCGRDNHAYRHRQKSRGMHVMDVVCGMRTRLIRRTQSLMQMTLHACTHSLHFPVKSLRIAWQRSYFPTGGSYNPWQHTYKWF